MRLDRFIIKEEAYNGEELLAESKVSTLDRKCFAIKQVVADGDLTIDDALAAYGVTARQYEEYISSKPSP